MHGRVKVRTSDEEKARKEKERQEKLKVFKHAMQKIKNKREQCELDKELLELTGKVLSSNPDIYTLWNIRREILHAIGKNYESEDEMSHMYDAELHLTEYCLKINPKSYCAWHQREWVLTTRVDPDWDKELALCNMYLKLDERNFHTWDYRRFIVSQCKPPLNGEFNFTTEKLHDNFSNYSAWHYRSKMLVELYPGLQGGRPIEDSHHKFELKMVQNAAFTDPDDTSAWFYQRWLLGAVRTTIEPVVCVVTPSKTTLAFSKHVDNNFVTSKTRLFIDNKVVDGYWYSCTGNRYDVLWIYDHKIKITDDLNVQMEFDEENGEKRVFSFIMHKQSSYIAKNVICFDKKYSEPVVEELNNQLEACRQLLELEPNNKWTLLTTTVFLHCIKSKEYHKEVIENLKTLINIDKLRAGYYNDMMAKWSVEEQLVMDYKENKDLMFKIKFPERISSLPHLQYYSYCELVDLSNQNLSSQSLPSLIVLKHCKRLSLENNKLTSLKNFPAIELEELNISGNNLDAKEVEKFKQNCTYKVIY